MRATDGESGRRRTAARATGRAVARADSSSLAVGLTAAEAEVAAYRRLESELPASLGALLAWRAGRTPDRPAFRVFAADTAADGPGADDTAELSWGRVLSAVDEIAAGLLGLGVQLEQTVAIMSTARLDGLLMDLAVARAGAASLAVHPSSRAADLAFVLRDSAACVMVAEDSAEVAEVGELWPGLPDLQVVVVLDSSAMGPGSAYAGDRRVISLDDVRARGQTLLARDRAAVQRRSAVVTGSHLASLAYTAGTTGRPKGVPLPHRAWLAQAAMLAATGVLTHRDLQFSWRPAPPALGKALLVVQMLVGFTAVISADQERAGHRVRRARPTFLVTSPYTCERLRCRWQARLGLVGPVRARLSAWAVGVGRLVDLARSTGDRPPAWLAVRHATAARWILRRIRRRLGGQVRFILCGAAPLDDQVCGWFRAIGVPVLPAYGLAEEAGLSLLGRPGRGSDAAVVRPLPGAAIRLDLRGELTVQGPNVMTAYHHLPGRTADVLGSDGWLRTGDLGELVGGGLRITGRSADLITLVDGSTVQPWLIEGALKAACPWVSHVVVCGQGRPYLTALVALDPDDLATWAQRHGMAGESAAAVARSPQVRRVVAGALDRLAAGPGPGGERPVRRFAVLPTDLTVRAGELTSTFGVRRAVVQEHYADLLADLYR